MKFLLVKFLFWFIELIDCSPEDNFAKNSALVRAVTGVYFRGQRSITVFNVDEGNIFDHNIVLNNLEEIAPVKIFSYVNKTLSKKIHDMGNELDLPKTTEGYFTIGKSLEQLKKNLKHFSKINTNGKWLVFLYNVKKVDADALLITAFVNFKMLNIFSVFYDENFDLFVSSYNPFLVSKSNQRGKIWTRSVNKDTLPEVLTEVDDIFDKKIGNLHEFPLKVAVINEKQKSGIYELLDRKIFDTFKKILNCNFTFVESRDGLFGSRLSNGTYTGKNRFAVLLLPYFSFINTLS
jgi:hypothetical protein